MPFIIMFCLVLALVCFLLGVFQVQPPSGRQINWMSAGLALLTVAYLLLR